MPPQEELQPETTPADEVVSIDADLLGVQHHQADDQRHETFARAAEEESKQRKLMMPGVAIHPQKSEKKDQGYHNTTVGEVGTTKNEILQLLESTGTAGCSSGVGSGGVASSTSPPLGGTETQMIASSSQPGEVQGPGAYAQSGPGFSPSESSGADSSVEDNDSAPPVIAHEVSSSIDGVDLEEAQPVDPSNLGSTRSKSSRTSISSNQSLSLGILSIVVVVLLVVIVVVLVSTKKDNDTVMAGMTKPAVPVSSTAISAEEDREAYLKGILTATPTLSTAFLLESSPNGTSHQQLAFDWILQDPHFDNYTAERIVQRYALSIFFYSTRGTYWTSNSKWLSYDDHECDWFGSDTFRLVGAKETADSPCNPTTSLYERLWLPNNNLTGTIPDEMYALTSLQSINFWRNINLSGTISPMIAQLPGLEKLSFFNCNMNGTVPPEIGPLSRLRVFYLAGNKFIGTLPKELIHLSSLEHFALGFNQFSGTFPSLVGGMRNMSTLGFQENSFTGQVPSQLGLIGDKLRFLYLSGNWRMNSVLPSELGLLKSLIAIHAQNSSLFGSLPTELGSNRNLKELVLAENNLTGSLPSQIGLLSSLRMLFLAANPRINGTLPEELWNLTKMELWDVSGTGIMGNIPENFQDLPTYEDFMLCGGRRYPC